MALSQIVEIAKRSAQYVANMSDNVVRVIESNEQKTTAFNKLQMLSSKNALGTPLINNQTGSANLSKAYARRMGKKKPNIFVTGEYQKAMFMTMPDEKNYFITSEDDKVRFLPDNYNDLHGISPVNQPKVQKINNALVIDDYKKTVFQ